MNRRVRHTFAALLVVVVGCTGTDVGNPVVDVDLELYNESIPPGSSARRADGNVDIDDGWVSVSVLRLRSGAACDVDEELEIPAGVAVDLFASGSEADLAGFDVPAGDYCQFRVKLDGFAGTPPAGAPDELVGSAIVLAGTRGDATPFVLQSDQDEELTFDARGGAFTVSDATNALVVGLDALELFRGVDLDGAVVGGDGVIRISPDDNKPLLDQFQSNLDGAAELFDDDDGDGVLDPDEREDADVLAE